MPAISELSPDRGPALRALAARLKHDLGKYIAFGARWLPEDASAEEQAEALSSDLLHTRRGPDGEQDALSVWAPYAARLCGRAPLEDDAPLDVSDDPDIRIIRDAMRALSPLVDALRAGESLDAEQLAGGLALSRRVSEACRTFHRRVNEAFPDHG